MTAWNGQGISAFALASRVLTAEQPPAGPCFPVDGCSPQTYMQVCVAVNTQAVPKALTWCALSRLLKSAAPPLLRRAHGIWQCADVEVCAAVLMHVLCVLMHVLCVAAQAAVSIAEFVQRQLWDPQSKRLRRAFCKAPSKVEGELTDAGGGLWTLGVGCGAAKLGCWLEMISWSVCEGLACLRQLCLLTLVLPVSNCCTISYLAVLLSQPPGMMSAGCADDCTDSCCAAQTTPMARTGACISSGCHVLPCCCPTTCRLCR